ncbi:MAG: DUF1905 domain-containing protein [Propionicimonas sp.]|nr:DUF1905 domain-containing protein [Propionicimonas sp.]
MRFEFDSAITRWRSREDSWYFAHVPAGDSAELRGLPLPRRGFGSLRVRVTIGTSAWQTSVFPDSDGRYALPLKRQVREREGLEEGDTVRIAIELVDLEP